jgi:hypothetical protein
MICNLRRRSELLSVGDPSRLIGCREPGIARDGAIACIDLDSEFALLEVPATLGRTIASALRRGILSHSVLASRTERSNETDNPRPSGGYRCRYHSHPAPRPPCWLASRRSNCRHCVRYVNTYMPQRQLVSSRLVVSYRPQLQGTSA